MQPAALHMPISSRTRSRTLPAELFTLSKILEFLSFQILQCNRMTIVSKFFLIGFGIPFLAFSHHSSVVLKLSSGIMKSVPVRALNCSQTILVNSHCTNRCVHVSGAAEHKGHMPLDGQFLHSKLSAVKHLLCTASHMKNLHHGDALDLQISL